MNLGDLSDWASQEGLEIVLLVLGSVLLTRLIRWSIDRMVSAVDRRNENGAADALSVSEARKHERALAQVIGWGCVVLVYLVTVVMVIQRLNVPVTSLVAPATLLGAALGFGAQRLVQDLLSGFFIITERQYGYGDVVRVSPPGTTTGVSGTVEEVTLRITRLRTVNGELLTLPNGEIRQVTNLSRDWARAVIDVPIPVGTDINRVSSVLRTINEAAFADEDLRPQLLDAPSVMGVEELDVGFLKMRVVARTLPGKQFDVGRILRARIALALQAEGLNVPPTFVDAPPTSAS